MRLDRLPRETVLRGGVIMPMHQAEAMWVNFDARWDSSYPCAVKVAAGKVCAVSGEPWSDQLDADSTAWTRGTRSTQAAAS